MAQVITTMNHLSSCCQHALWSACSLSRLPGGNIYVASSLNEGALQRQNVFSEPSTVALYDSHDSLLLTLLRYRVWYDVLYSQRIQTHAMCACLLFVSQSLELVPCLIATMKSGVDEAAKVQYYCAIALCNVLR